MSLPGSTPWPTLIEVVMECSLLRDGCDASADDLCLHLLELGVGDRAAGFQVGELLDLVGAAITAAHAADVLARRGVSLLREFERALVHLSAAHDQVHEDAEERKEDHEDRPARL